MCDYTKEEFISVWEDSTRKEILNQFYHEHILLQKVNDTLDSHNEMINNLQERIDKAIEYIDSHKRKDEFLNLNEWGTRDLLEILKGEE